MVDGDIKSAMTAGLMTDADKEKSMVKRSNSGEFKKPMTQDIDVDESSAQIDSGLKEDPFAPQEDDRG